MTTETIKSRIEKLMKQNAKKGLTVGELTVLLDQQGGRLLPLSSIRARTYELYYNGSLQWSGTRPGTDGRTTSTVFVPNKAL